jgi:hypothetical protein
MHNGLSELMNRVSHLRNEELLKMVHIDAAQYRPEAIGYAKAEIERRGLLPDDVVQTRVSTSPYRKRVAALGKKFWFTVRRNAFALGFFTVLLFLIAANIYSFIYTHRSEGMPHGELEYGFPFKWYVDAYLRSYLLWDGLVNNILLALVAGLVMGLICKLLFGIRVKREII